MLMATIVCTFDFSRPQIKQGSKGDCSVLHPSCMCAVPLVIDRIYKGIHENINAKGEFFK
jgi:long-chain acyl-CoA synthetase